MYIGDDVPFPVLTPNILIHEQPITIPEKHFDDDDKALKNCYRYTKNCKDAVWN